MNLRDLRPEMLGISNFLGRKGVAGKGNIISKDTVLKGAVCSLNGEAEL